MRWSIVLPFFLGSPAQSYSLDEIAKRYTQQQASGIHLPIVKQKTNTIQRRAFSVSGLGDHLDV